MCKRSSSARDESFAKLAIASDFRKPVNDLAGAMVKGEGSNHRFEQL